MAKMRSPNYPAVGLSEAVNRVRALWSKEKRTPVDAAVAAEAIGYSGLSGPSRTALASMKKYGLVDSDDRTVRVSDRALQILHPASEEEELTALQMAALSPELFRQLFESQRDASDVALKSYLINKLGFSEVGARQLIKAFRDTMTFAKLDKPNSYPSQAMLAEDHTQAPVYDDDDHMLKDFQRNARPDARNNRQFTTHQTYSWPLSPGVTGEVRIIGDAPKPQHLRAIRSYLELAEKLMKTEEPAESEKPLQLGEGGKI
ncbi:MAG TPA: hypothetical protein VKR59_04605 [Terriglobales bacterium]|nr:hypothetical protein [Terriglobales bacterium]